jgi:large subunit ribosomal protein L7/L12
MNSKSKLEKLKEQKAKLEARIQMVEAREKTKDHKKDTRRKILIGSYYLDKARKNNSMSELAKIMDGYLTRENDRILFDLSLRNSKK